MVNEEITKKAILKLRIVGGTMRTQYEPPVMTIRPDVNPPKSITIAKMMKYIIIFFVLIRTAGSTPSKTSIFFADLIGVLSSEELMIIIYLTRK